MRATTTAFPGYARQPGDASIKRHSKRGFRNRCRHFVEDTDWDEKFLEQGKWMYGIGVGVAVLSILYFTPLIILSFLK